MSIQAAKLFIKGLQFDKAFRKDVSATKNIDEFNEVLDDYDLKFSSSEVEESYNMLKVQCQFEEQADSLQNAISYYYMILRSFEIEAEKHQ